MQQYWLEKLRLHEIYWLVNCYFLIKPDLLKFQHLDQACGQQIQLFSWRGLLICFQNPHGVAWGEWHVCAFAFMFTDCFWLIWGLGGDMVIQAAVLLEGSLAIVQRHFFQRICKLILPIVWKQISRSLPRAFLGSRAGLSKITWRDRCFRLCIYGPPWKKAHTALTVPHLLATAWGSEEEKMPNLQEKGSRWVRNSKELQCSSSLLFSPRP